MDDFHYLSSIVLAKLRVNLNLIEAASLCVRILLYSPILNRETRDGISILLKVLIVFFRHLRPCIELDVFSKSRSISFVLRVCHGEGCKTEGFPLQDPKLLDFGIISMVWILDSSGSGFWTHHLCLHLISGSSQLIRFTLVH